MSIWETIQLSGLANFIEHEAIMLNEVLHHPTNREDALRRIHNLQEALAEMEQRFEAEK